MLFNLSILFPNYLVIFKMRTWLSKINTKFMPTGILWWFLFKGNQVFNSYWYHTSIVEVYSKHGSRYTTAMHGTALHCYQQKSILSEIDFWQLRDWAWEVDWSLHQHGITTSEQLNVIHCYICLWFPAKKQIWRCSIVCHLKYKRPRYWWDCWVIEMDILRRKCIHIFMVYLS